MIPVTITLDKVRHIRYPWRAIVDAEHEAKRGLNFILMSGSIEYTILMLWAGLKSEDPGLTIDQTGDLIEKYLDDGKSLEELTNAIREGLEKGGWVKQSPEAKVGG